MKQDILESLWNYLQLFYLHLELILKLTKPKHSKKQICPNDGQKTDMNFRDA
jgi:hypothetical protein